MKPRIFAFFTGLAFSLLDLSAKEPSETVLALQARLRSHVSQPRFAGAIWAVKIVSLEGGGTLFELNADKLLKPASNAKLFSAALALDQLGPDYRSKTSVYHTGPAPRSGVLEGNLIVYGRGDPTFTARFHPGASNAPLDALVNEILATGLKEIRGDLVADESYFRGPPFGAGWALDDIQASHGAAVSALSLEDNVIELSARPAPRLGDPGEVSLKPRTDYPTLVNQTRTIAAGAGSQIETYRPPGSKIIYLRGVLPLNLPAPATLLLPIPDPAAFFIHQLRAALRSRGCIVHGQTRTITWLDLENDRSAVEPRTEIASVTSPPLREVLPHVLKPSQNLYAQLLLLQVGAQAEMPPDRDVRTRAGESTEEKGIAALREFLNKIAVKEEDALIEEGSGLSRTSLVKPGAIIKLLAFMNQHRHRAIFRNALPIAGVDGTLRGRMRGTAASGNARAKTGSLRYTHTLAGYVTTAAQQPLAFSLMLNNFYDPQNQGRQDLDAIVIWLAEFNGRIAPETNP